MKKKSFVVQVQFGRCIMLLETKESTANDIVIHVKDTNFHFSLREFVVVIGLNCVSNKYDFVFDEDLPNRLIEDYFGGAKYIQKRELFSTFSEKKIWGKDNDEDAVKFANLYFIHAFLLSAVDTVVIPRLHFDLVESDRYSDYPWGSVAFEELAKSLYKKLKPKDKFHMLHEMPLAIQIWLYECCSTIPHNVALRVDNQILRLLNWKINAPRPRYESLIESMFNNADVKISFKNIEPTRKEISCFQIPKKVVPAGKKLKQQHKGLDEQTPKRTPPPRAAKKLSVRTPIFIPIQQKKKVASKRKDINRSANKKSILIQSPDSSLCSSENEDDFVSQKVFHKFRNKIFQEMISIRGLVSTRCDEIMNAISEIKKKNKDNQVDNPLMGEADKTTPHHEFTSNFVHDLYKNSKGTLVTEDINGNQSASLMEVNNEDKGDVLDKTDIDQHEARDICESLNTKLVDDNISEAHISDSQFSFPDEELSSINLDFIKSNLGVEDESMNTGGAAETTVNTSAEDKSKKSKYDPNTSYKYNTVDCNFMNIINNVLVVYRIDDASLNTGGKEYHLNEYINGFHIHNTVPWNTVDHIFIPINVKAKHHWVLAVISFNDRCIYVCDSLSSTGHDAEVLAEVEKLVEVISIAEVTPICLVACKFYEKKGIDTANHPNYKSYDKMDLFDVYVMEDLPQQPSDSLDCGLYMLIYAECLTFGVLVSPVDFDSDLIHTRYDSILWNYGIKKEEENAQSDDEAPMRPPREIGLQKILKCMKFDISFYFAVVYII
ncbi:hypothetical protein T459_28282 [Capsicum annuum]|uniref:Ubiquitin-like protease family profile domain-containing protein n=1 Tax=Capsicum annuum TaxID=4072 RepID=A0A2G2YGF3_CAPAN|nr:hypothetical protein T459_28282 [Capsicum annuum]